MRDPVQNLFVIDATFLVRASREAFMGAPLFEANGVDQTFEYGICRDLLRLRQAEHSATAQTRSGTEAPCCSRRVRRANMNSPLMLELPMPPPEGKGFRSG